MDTKEVKVGERYKLELLCISTSHHIAFETPTGNKVAISKHDLECVSPAAPKYDPNRPFRKGDKVKAVLRHGRIPNDGVPKDVILKVIEDERDGIVKVLHKMGAILELFNVYALYLELLTPVEELEPYHLNEIYDIDDGKLIGYEVARGDTRDAIFYGGENHLRTIEQAKERAEAERDRLNAEYRKEMEK